MLDNSLFFSNKQKVTATVASENSICFGGGDSHHGLYLVVQVGTAFAGLTSLKVGVETSDSEDFSSAETIVELPTYQLADLSKDRVLSKICIPLGMKKYSRIKYTVNGTGTAGDISAFLTDNPGIGI